MDGTPITGCVVVGLRPGRVHRVLDQAIRTAERFGVGLVCVTADPSFVSVGKRRDGSEIVEAIDPDVGEAAPSGLTPADCDAVRAAASAVGVEMELLTRAGDPTRALGAVAAERDAVVIVVGARAGRHRIAEFFDGSVAARLAHQQDRPVMVVPVPAARPGAPLPWHGE